jgi:hypothetical protein
VVELAGIAVGRQEWCLAKLHELPGMANQATCSNHAIDYLIALRIRRTHEPQAVSDGSTFQDKQLCSNAGQLAIDQTESVPGCISVWAAIVSFVQQ